MAYDRVTITLPHSLVEDMDRRGRNRSKFIRQAIRHELDRQGREALQRSLRSPHSEGRETAELGLEDWATTLPEADGLLLDPDLGTGVEWRPEVGWVEVEE